MAAPTSFSQPAQPFIFLREANGPGNGMTIDPRVRVERVTQGARGDGSADLLLNWEGDALADGTVLQTELTDTQIASLYGPTVRCAVAQAPPPGGTVDDLVFVAHGYVETPQLQFGATPRQRFLRRRMKMRDVLRRICRREDAWIQGQWRLSLDGWEHARDNPEEDPLYMPWVDLGFLLESVPCIFNPNGKPNRMAKPVLFDATDSWAVGPIHLFTDADDPDAEYWTYFQALRYLLLLHMPYGDGAYVDPGNIFVSAHPELVGPDNDWWAEDETDVPLAGDYADGWHEHVTRRCKSLALEGMDLLEALIAWSAASGVDFGVEHNNVTTGGVIECWNELRFFAPGDIANAQLAIEKNATQFSPGGTLRPVPEILAANNVSNGQAAREFGNAVALVKVMGGAYWKTVLAELVPLWTPDADWDSIADLAAARAAAYSDDDPYASTKDTSFFQQFRKDGTAHTGANRIVGRLWGIDPAGALDAATYNRHAPFDDAYGDPWAIPGVTMQIPRRRPIRAIPTIAGYPPLNVVLECTFDASSETPTWYRLETRAVVIPKLAAISLEAVDLLAVGSEILRRLDDAGTPADSKNYYDAYISGAFKLRAMFDVQMDERMQYEAAAANTAIPAQGITALFIRDKDFNRNDVSNLVPDDVEALVQDIDDSDSMEEFAKLVLADRAGAQWSGRFTVPWVELDALVIGTPVEGIRRAAGGAIEIPFGGSATRAGRYPVVVQKIYTCSREGGVSTEVVLNDFRFSKATSPRE